MLLPNVFSFFLFMSALLLAVPTKRIRYYKWTGPTTRTSYLLFKTIRIRRVNLPSIMCLLSSSVVRSSARITSSVNQKKKINYHYFVEPVIIWYMIIGYGILKETIGRARSAYNCGTMVLSYYCKSSKLTGFAYPVYVTVELAFQLLLSP